MLTDMLGDLQRAKIVVTNYHGLRPRERLSISSGGRDLLQGPGEPIETLETEGQMMQRVMPELMGLKNIVRGPQQRGPPLLSSKARRR